MDAFRRGKCVEYTVEVENHKYLIDILCANIIKRIEQIILTLIKFIEKLQLICTAFLIYMSSAK